MTVGTLHVVVAGGGASGMSAASRIKRLLPKADVKVFERSSFVSYAPCGIPYLLGDVVDSLDKLVHYFVDFFQRGRDIILSLRLLRLSWSLKPSRANFSGLRLWGMRAS